MTPSASATLGLMLVVGGQISQALPPASAQHAALQPPRPLTGRFLHITDFHPDPYYETYSSTSSDAACHRGTGPAGYYGAETSGCDSPLSLINATFDWIDQNIRDQIDFIVWTGDSARHDNDDKIPRTEAQVVAQNEFIVDKFRQVFGRRDDDDDDPTNDFTIPIIPTVGNNDILPHNIFLEGPNRWTQNFLHIWRNFIPEEQRHQFQRGGWFYVEAIPNKLAVVSLNTMYFFDSNSGVDGCAMDSEPGYEHFEWLRIQLQIFRDRGMKVILIGHVPPARTANKQSWDETCWQKYTFWMQQHRDIIITSMYGHMNIDHFILHDFSDIKNSVRRGKMKGSMKPRLSAAEEDEISVQSAEDYLVDLRNAWSTLPAPVRPVKPTDSAAPAGNQTSLLEAIQGLFGKEDVQTPPNDDSDFLEGIGGKFGERYGHSIVGASIIPNFFPSMRVIEYNITGIESVGAPVPARSEASQELQSGEDIADSDTEDEDFEELKKKKRNNKKGKGKALKKKKYKFTVPEGPSKSSPPGPAYSPQTLSLVGYTQYFANLTRLNNDFAATIPASATDAEDDAPQCVSSNPTSCLYADEDGGGGALGGDLHDYGDGFTSQRWREGKHRGKKPKPGKPQPKPFAFEKEYSTFDEDDEYKLPDLTVRSYINLAHRIGSFGKDGFAAAAVAPQDEEEEEVSSATEGEGAREADDVDARLSVGKGKKKPKPKHHVWYEFVRRAFVSTLDQSDIEGSFGPLAAAPQPQRQTQQQQQGVPLPPPAEQEQEEEAAGLGDGEL
ncbi:endopolyphosphatase [Phyllosticta citrichinensis]|uniref:Endopolyphosphatase n=1 Tax=Phyllosticta citrichinensis TaxID=1130410 RepID=A0ABR1XUC7_9PEZI